MLPYPFLYGFTFHFQLLPARSMQYAVLPPVACCIVMRKSKEIKAFLCSLISAKGQYSAFILCDFETKFLQSFYQKLIKLSRFILVLEQTYKVSRPRELPPKPLSEPYVNLSAHTAPIIQPMAIFQTSNERRVYCLF